MNGAGTESMQADAAPGGGSAGQHIGAVELTLLSIGMFATSQKLAK